MPEPRQERERASEGPQHDTEGRTAPDRDEQDQPTHDPATVLRRMLATPPVKRKRQD